MRATKEEKASRIVGQLLAKKAVHETSQRIEQLNEKEFSQRYTNVINGLKNGLRQNGEKSLSDETQTSLAKSVGLLTDIAVTDISWLGRNPHLIDAVDTSIKALLNDPPSGEHDHRRQGERRLRDRSYLRRPAGQKAYDLGSDHHRREPQQR
jgi:hypothetical protein